MGGAPIAIGANSHQFHSFSTIISARVERFELPSTVLETGILPLNYTRKSKKSPKNHRVLLANYVVISILYLRILVTCPAPTVLPPSLIANLNPSLIATGTIRFTVIETLSPGITISLPSSRMISPVTSVVLK
jgi:hypothetical protein